MAKKLNKNMVAGLTAFGFLLMTAAGILMVLQLRETDPKKFAELADHCMERGDLVQAAGYYNRAFMVSNDPAYLIKQGDIMLERGDERRAQTAWEMALTIDPQLEPALRKLLDFGLSIAQRYGGNIELWNRVRQSADKVLELAPDDPQAKFCKGSALLEMRDQAPGNAKEGMALLREAVAADPENVEYALRLAVQESQEAESEVSNDIFQRLVEGNTTPGRDAYRIRSLFGEVLARQANIARVGGDAEEASRLKAEAIKNYEEAVELAGSEPEDQASARAYLAQYWLFEMNNAKVDPNLGDEVVDDYVSKIETLLREAIAKYPEGFESYLLLSDCYRLLGRHREAAAVCEERIDQKIKRQGAKATQAKQGLYRVLLRAADSCIVEATQHEQGSSERESLLDKAEGYIEDARAEFPDTPWVETSAGKLMLARARDLDAIAAFERARSLFRDPDWETEHFLAGLYLQNGQVTAARDAAKTAAESPYATPNVWVTYAQTQLSGGDYRAAIESTQKALAMESNNIEAIRIRLEAFRKMGRTELIKQDLERFTAKKGDSSYPMIALFNAQFKANNEEWDEAMEALSPLLESDPTNYGYVSLAARVLANSDRNEEAMAIVNRAIELDPDRLSFRKMAVFLRDDLTAEEKNQALFDVISNAPDLFVRALELSQWYIDNEELDKADQSLREAERVLQEHGTESARQLAEQGGMVLRQVLDKRFIITLIQEDWEKAEALAARCRDENLDGAQGLTYYGRIHLLKKDPAAAVEALNKALELQPKNSQTWVFLGQAYLDMNRIDEASAAFDKALEINDNAALAHKGKAMLARGRNAEVYARHIAECKRLIPSDPWVKREMTLIEEATSPADSIERRLKIRDEKPDDWHNRMVLADLYVKTGDNAQAESMVKEALQVSGHNPQALLTASEFYFKMGRPDKAIETLREGARLQEDPRGRATANVLLARLLQKSGKQEEADEHFRRAVEENESVGVLLSVAQHYYNTGRTAETLPWLQRALALTGDSRKDITPDVHAMYIECLATLERYDEAALAVEKSLEQFPQHKLVLILRSDMEARVGEIDKAINTLTTYLQSEDREKWAHAMYRRASLYAAQGRWNLAIEDLEKVRARQPLVLDLKPRMLLARAYEMTNRLDLASAELEGLVKEFPSKGLVAHKLIALYVDNKRYDDAHRVATRMANSAPDNPRWPLTHASISMAEQSDRKNKGLPVEPERALQYLRQALQMTNYAPLSVASTMEFYKIFELVEEGIRFFEKELPQSHNNPHAVRGYASLLAMAGREEESIKNFRISAVMAPDLDFTRAVIADMLQFLKAENAIRLLRTPVSDERMQRKNQQLLAMVLASNKQSSEAIEIYNTLLASTQSPKEKTDIKLLIAMAKDTAKDPAGAVELYKAVIQDDPENWAALNNVAFLLSDSLGRHEEALQYAELAHRLNSVPQVADTLGTVYLNLGRLRQAVGVLNGALQIEAEYVPALMHSAEAYRRMGSFDKAQAMLNELERIERKNPERLADYTEEIGEVKRKVAAQDKS